MEEFYPYILVIIHLFSAIFFVGYLFTDIFILNVFKKKNPDFDKEVFKVMEMKIMPIVVLFLFLSGAFLTEFDFKALNLLFTIKIVLAFVVLILVVFSLLYRFLLKKKIPLIYPFIFVLCIFVIMLAKLMDYFFVA